jgi:hypothetical protein
MARDKINEAEHPEYLIGEILSKLPNGWQHTVAHVISVRELVS